jgi:ATP-dependent DNA ligase
VASFNALRRGDGPERPLHCAFDLLMLDGCDLRSEPLETRKGMLGELLAGRRTAWIVPNAHYEADGPTVFVRACAFGCEGIVSKLKGSRYRSGVSRDWVKSKNPASEAVRREATEDWRR